MATVVETHSRGGVFSRSRGKTGVRGRFVAIGILFALVMGVIGGIFGASSAYANDDDDQSGRYSLYNVTSFLTAMTSNAMAPDAMEDRAELQAGWRPVLDKAGNAGSLLSYADPEFFDLKGWGMAGMSMASTNIGYDKLRNMGAESGEENRDDAGLLGYAYYGSALSQLGFDQTATGGGMDIMRPLGGGLMFGAFLLAWAVTGMFSGTISILQFLNPFRLFSGAIDSAIAGGVQSANPVFSGLATFVGDLYGYLTGLSWAVIVPMFIGFFLLGLLFLKSGNTGGKIKKLVVRLLFIGIGVPLLGGLYTGVLNQMVEENDPRRNAPVSVIASTFVDFGTWAREQRLRPPTGIMVDDEGIISPESLKNTRVLAQEINGMANPAAFGHLGGGRGVSAGEYGDNSIVDNAYGDLTEGNNTGGISGANLTEAVVATASMLDRYMKGEQVSSASFESAFSDRMEKFAINDGGITAGDVQSWFDHISVGGEEELRQSYQSQNGENTPVANPLIAVPYPFTMQDSGSMNTFVNHFGQVGSCNYSVQHNDSRCAMSPLSIFNYLNTSFDTTSMTLYSSNNSSSNLVRESHMEVNLAGNGIMSLLYWTNSFLLLASFVVIGFTYAFALLFASVRRTFNLIGSIPFAVVGFMGGIVKTIVYAVALIAEVVVTIYGYMLVQQFLKALPDIIEMPMAMLMSNTSLSNISGAIVAATPAIPIVSTLFSIVAIIIFTTIALKIRKGMVKAIESGATNILNKFLDTSVGTGGAGGGMVPALAGGLAAGAGVAAANKAMGGGPVGGVGAANGDGGPGSVGVGASTGNPAGGDSSTLALGGNQNSLTSSGDTNAGDMSALDAGSSMENSSSTDGTTLNANDMSAIDAADRAEAANATANGLPRAASLGEVGPNGVAAGENPSVSGPNGLPDSSSTGVDAVNGGNGLPVAEGGLAGAPVAAVNVGPNTNDGVQSDAGVGVGSSQFGPADTSAMGAVDSVGSNDGVSSLGTSGAGESSFAQDGVAGLSTAGVSNVDAGSGTNTSSDMGSNSLPMPANGQIPVGTTAAAAAGLAGAGVAAANSSSGAKGLGTAAVASSGKKSVSSAGSTSGKSSSGSGQIRPGGSQKPVSQQPQSKPISNAKPQQNVSQRSSQTNMNKQEVTQQAMLKQQQAQLRQREARVASDNARNVRQASDNAAKQRAATANTNNQRRLIAEQKKANDRRDAINMGAMQSAASVQQEMQRKKAAKEKNRKDLMS